MVKNKIEIDVADVLLEAPVGFSIGRRRFYLYPPTLGKSFVVEQALDHMGLMQFNDEKMSNYMMLATAGVKRKEFIKIIAYYTLPKDECLDLGKVERRCKELRRLKAHQAASLLSIVLSMDKGSEIRKHYGFDDEAKRLAAVMKAKSQDGNNVVFGGCTVWGSLIDFVAERYGWTLDYILWGISYANLSLLMEDHVRSVYLTDEELKKARLPKDNVRVKADDASKLEDFITTQNWR